jgi:hypothetical protein
LLSFEFHSSNFENILRQGRKAREGHRDQHCHGAELISFPQSAEFGLRMGSSEFRPISVESKLNLVKPSVSVLVQGIMFISYWHFDEFLPSEGSET